MVKFISVSHTVWFKNDLESKITIKLGCHNAKIYKGEKTKSYKSATSEGEDGSKAVNDDN